MGDFVACEGSQIYKFVSFGTLTAPGGNNTKSAYTVVNNPMPTVGHGIYLHLQEFTTLSRATLIDIAVDPADDPIISNIPLTIGDTIASQLSLFVPILVPAASRLYARYQMSGSGSDLTLRASVGSPNFFARPFGACDTWGVSTATSRATVVTPGSTWSKGSWALIADGLPLPVKGFVVILTHNAFSITTGMRHSLDVGIGPSTLANPDTTVVNDIPFGSSGAAGEMIPRVMGPFLVPVPQGFSIWVRMAAQGTAQSYRAAILTLR